MTDQTQLSQAEIPQRNDNQDGGQDRKTVIAVVGPTATGKTGLAVSLAEWLDTEVISADSQVIYRELNIGTAKPTAEEARGIPHHMLDVASPDEVYSVSTYQRESKQHLERLWRAGKIPVVAGGTGFYLKALLQADFIPDVPPDPAFREGMAQLAATHPDSNILHRMLSEKDPARAAMLHPHDHIRVIRALEIIEATGQPVPQRSQDRRLSVHWIGLTFTHRDLLRARIDRRIEAMMRAGWLEEVRLLIDRYGPDAHALKVAHGYPELVSVVQGKYPLEEALEKIRINVHQYMRRQMTWFNRNPEINWFFCDLCRTDPLHDLIKKRITKSISNPRFHTR